MRISRLIQFRPISLDLRAYHQQYNDVTDRSDRGWSQFVGRSIPYRISTIINLLGGATENEADPISLHRKGRNTKYLLKLLMETSQRPKHLQQLLIRSKLNNLGLKFSKLPTLIRQTHLAVDVSLIFPESSSTLIIVK